MKAYFKINDDKVSVTLMQTSVPLNENEGWLADIDMRQTIVSIPQEVKNGNQIYRVTALGHNVFDNCPMKEVVIPASIVEIEWSFYQCRNLLNIKVDDGNTAFKDVDGVLFTKDGTHLMACPNARQSYDIPKGVSVIDSFAFKTSLIKTLTIPETVTEIGHDVFYRANNLHTVNLPMSLTRIGDVQYDTSTVFTYKGKTFNSKDIQGIVNKK